MLGRRAEKLIPDAPAENIAQSGHVCRPWQSSLPFFLALTACAAGDALSCISNQICRDKLLSHMQQKLVSGTGVPPVWWLRRLSRARRPCHYAVKAAAVAA